MPMSALDMDGSQNATEIETARWEKIGRWLMAGYWLAMLAVVTVAGIATGY
jgi:hypothetical protein